MVLRVAVASAQLLKTIPTPTLPLKGREQYDTLAEHYGCVMQWKSLPVGPDSNTGVNARNFEPSIIGKVPVRRLDGADTWEYL